MGFFSIDDPTISVGVSGDDGFRGNNGGVESLETSGEVTSSWSMTTTIESEMAAKLLPLVRSLCNFVVSVIAASLNSVGATNKCFDTL